MAGTNYYDVTEWHVGDPYEDIGQVINSIIDDVKKRQTEKDVREGGKPGAVIYIPVGDYHLRTQVVIDISYLKIMGSGHGFTSSSIRFNVPEDEICGLHELWPGGSRILVDLPAKEEGGEEAQAAFYVKREGSPRISSVEFENFCIDGLHFVDDGTGEPNPENTYVNGKTGIYVAGAQDSFRITGMGFVYLEHAITIYHADALSIHDNFIAECGSCIELRGWGQASKVTENLIGAGYKGYSIYAQNFGGLLISSNNIFPRGKSSVHLDGVARSIVTGNRFHSFYPGMLVLEGNCAENLISSNHFYRSREPWPPMRAHGNGLDDLYGLVYISGNHNAVTANHFSEILDEEYIVPAGAKPVIIRIGAGRNNYVCANHIAALTEAAEESKEAQDACYSAQVEAMLSIARAKEIPVIAVLVEEESVRNTILDTGTEEACVLDRKANAFRAIPEIGEC